MDLLTTAAARALAAGDPLGALQRVALREDAPALALRGIAMAQLGDFARARKLLRRAVRAFRPREVVARARCIVAEAEIALASRDLTWPAHRLATARAALAAHGDQLNAAHARYLEARRMLLTGRPTEAERAMAALDPAPFPPGLRAAHELTVAGIAMRRVRARAAAAALARAAHAARQASIPALTAEVEAAWHELHAPAARLIERGQYRPLVLSEVEAVLASPALVVDACRDRVACKGTTIALATRPVLFTLARALAEGWPDAVPRDALIARAFRLRKADASARARLRVELGRLRKAVRTLTGVRATARGFVLVPRNARRVAVLAGPADEQHGALLALLADGEAWSSAALALALGASQRNVQRTLAALAARGNVRTFRRGRALRWVTQPAAGFTTVLLLPAPAVGE